MSETKKLEVGDKAPPFNLPDQSGKKIALKDFLGKQRVVLYFYPRDNTPGCTKQACSLRDNLALIQKKGAVVLGVSPDSATAHQKFVEKYDLNFPLLVDEGHKLAETYGAWGEKVLYGKRSIGMIRKTFLIGLDGKLEFVNNKVKAADHGEYMLGKL